MILAVCAVLSSLLAASDGAGAQTVGPERQRNIQRSRTLGIDPQIFEERQRRRNFDKEQQRLRELDRDRGTARPLDLGVPRYQPLPQQPTDGNPYMRGIGR